MVRYFGLRWLPASLPLVLGLAWLLAACGDAGAGRSAPEEANASLRQAIPLIPPGAVPWPGALSGTGAVGRAASAGGVITLTGDQFFAKSDNASLDLPNQQLRLFAGAKELSWGIYAFGGVAQDDAPFGLRVTLSGAAPEQYYIGIADYLRQVWRWTPVSAPSGDDYLSLPAAWQPVSPDTVIYAAVVTWDGQAAALSSLELTLAVTVPPPLDLTASDGLHAGAVYLDWTDPAQSHPGLGYDAIRIERALDGAGPWAQIGSAAAGETHYEDLHDPAGNDYPYGVPLYYRVLTQVGAELSEPSLADSGYRILGNVAGLAASDGEYGDGIHLNWGSVVGAQSYVVEYMNGAGDPPDWTLLTTVPGVLAFIHSPTAPPGQEAQELTDYVYRVKAQYLADLSPEWSNADQGFFMATPSAVLTANKTRGPAPLLVEFDATGSYDPGGGGIIKYEWDWEGDGVWDLDSGTDGTQSRDYRQLGTFTAKVRVTDDELQTNSASLAIEVPGWVHSWGGSATDEAVGAAVDSQGNVWVGGVTRSASSAGDIVLLKYSPAGALLACQTWDNGSEESMRALACVGDSVYIAANAFNAASSKNGIAFLKYSTTGALLQQSLWLGSYSAAAFALAVAPNSDVYLAGRVEQSNGKMNLLVLKLNSAGVGQWSKCWGGSLDNEASACTFANDYLYITGVCNYNNGSGNVCLLRIAEDGTLGWEKSWDSGAADFGTGIAVDGGVVYICGATEGFGAANDDGLLLRYSAAGSLEWEKTWSQDSTTEEQFYGVCAAGGLVFCTGWMGYGGDMALPLLRFNSDGSCEYQRLFNTGAPSWGIVTSLQADTQVRLFGAGSAADAQGSWENISFTPVDRNGTTGDLAKAYFDASGAWSQLHGTVGTFTGVEDTGGGDNDAFVMCYETLTLE